MPDAPLPPPASPGTPPRDARLRVAIDATSLLGPRTGVGHVTASIIEGLAARDDVALFAYGVTRHRAGPLRALLPPGVHARTTGVPGRVLFRAWAHGDHPRIERWSGRIDVVHGTNFVVPPARAAQLLTLHDLTFARDPELCTADSRAYLGLVAAALGRGATVHVFSAAVAEEARARFGLGPDRVVCVAPGIADTTTGDAGAGRRRAGADRYLLALGTVEPRKNLPRLVAAFDTIADARPDLHLVVAGPDGWGTAEFDAACAAAGSRARIRRLGYLTDVERADVLAGATALAYPSLDEGFGHPPLEAMRAGVPVVAAAAGALPEVLGDAALLVDPRDLTALATALAEVVDDAATRRRLVVAGTGRVARYSWTRAVDGLVALYRRIGRRAQLE